MSTPTRHCGVLALDSTRSRLRTAVLLGVAFMLAFTGLAHPQVASAAAPRAVLGMPFTGMWAYNAHVNPPYTDANSSHPSVHHRYYGDWAIDVYQAAGAPVVLHATSPDGPVTFTYRMSHDSCSSVGPNIAGHGIVLNVLVGGATVGSVDFEHLDGISTGPYTNGMTLGYVTGEALSSSCYQARHIHEEFLNADQSTFSCWVDHGNPGNTVAQGDPLGVIGSTNTGPQQPCPDVPTTDNPGGGSTGGGATQTFPVMNTSEQLPDGVYFRNSPHTADHDTVAGHGIYSGEHVQVDCYAVGDPVGPYSNTIWYHAVDVERPTINGMPNSGYMNTHYVSDGQSAGHAAPGIPLCGAAPPPPPPPPVDGPQTFPVMNTSETLPDGIYFDKTPHTGDNDRITGLGVFAGEHVTASCYVLSDPVGPFSNTAWYFATNVERPTVNGAPNSGYINAHYVADGQSAGKPAPGIPSCPSAAGEGTPPPAPAPDGSVLGFDTASAPSLAAMRAWQTSSPYRAVGIYIPVHAAQSDDRADKTQANLTADWVTQTAAMGWRAVPIYFGKQAPSGCINESLWWHISNDPTVARQEGLTAAADAASSADSLGIPRTSPIVYDLEAYSRGCEAGLTAFLAGWTTGLHQAGRASSVYGSEGSTTTLLRDVATRPSPAPDAVWAATNNSQANTSSLGTSYAPWAGRLGNQYRLAGSNGNESWGGVTINVDRDAFDPGALTISVPDTTPPTVAITASPAAVSRSTSASFSFNGSDPGQSAAQLTYRCQLDSSTPVACTSPRVLTGLAQGVHTFKVAAVDKAGNASGTASRTWRVDTIAPTVTTSATPVFTLATSVELRYAGTDGNSGVASYDVRYRRAPYNGGFGAFASPTTSPDWTSITGTTVTLKASRGYTYCLSARARDKAGNVGAWSAERCTAVALDDRSLTASAGWTRGTGSGYYGGTVTSARRTNVALTRTGMQARRISLVATRCPGCGSVAVYWNRALIRTISLSSTTTHNRQVLAIAIFAGVRTGTLVIRTRNSSSTRIDGLASSRT